MLRPVARQSAALCHSPTRHVGLHNLILQQDERAAGRGVHCVPCHVIAGQITDMGVAGTWLTSQVAYDSGCGVGCGRTAPRRTLLWSAVKLVAKYFSIWMRVGGTNYIIARGWWHTCVWRGLRSGRTIIDDLTDGRTQHSNHDLSELCRRGGRRRLAIWSWTR